MSRFKIELQLLNIDKVQVIKTAVKDKYPYYKTVFFRDGLFALNIRPD